MTAGICRLMGAQATWTGWSPREISGGGRSDSVMCDCRPSGLRLPAKSWAIADAGQPRSRSRALYEIVRGRVKEPSPGLLLSVVGRNRRRNRRRLRRN